MLATKPVLGRAHETVLFDGRSLRELLARGERPDREKLVGWGIRLLNLLAESHAQGLVYGDLKEEDVLLTPDGYLFVAFSPVPASEPFTAQSDLFAVGCLLRRLAFAASIRGGRGSRDPLVKVLARATFASPAARYPSALEMAEALSEAGRTVTALGPKRLEERPSSSPVAVFPPSHPIAPAKKTEVEGDFWYGVALLVISLLLMSCALATGWFIPRQDPSDPPVASSTQGKFFPTSPEKQKPGRILPRAFTLHVLPKQFKKSKDNSLASQELQNLQTRPTRFGWAVLATSDRPPLPSGAALGEV